MIWITGNSGAGKSTLAKQIQAHIPDSIILDGDELREVWGGSLDKAGRVAQTDRTVAMANLLKRQGHFVIVAVICPFNVLQEYAQKNTGCTFLYLEGGKIGKEYPYEPPTVDHIKLNMLGR